MEQNDSKKIILSVLGIAILIVAVVGISYAVFIFTSDSKTENVINTGTISMSFTEGITNVMTISNAIPTQDEVGKKQSDYFDFNVSATIAGITDINYQIIAKNLTAEKENEKFKIPLVNQLSGNQVKLYLEKKEGSEYKQVLLPTMFDQLNSATGNDTKLLYSGTFSNNTTESNKLMEEFKLRMWLNSDAVLDEVTRTFKIRVDINATT